MNEPFFVIMAVCINNSVGLGFCLIFLETKTRFINLLAKVGFDLDCCHIPLTVWVIYSINIFLGSVAEYVVGALKVLLVFWRVKVGIMHMLRGIFPPCLLKTHLPEPSLCFALPPPAVHLFRPLFISDFTPDCPSWYVTRSSTLFYIWSSASVLAL